MPYKSEAQRKYFNANREKLEADGVDVDHWNETSKGKELPEKKSSAASTTTNMTRRALAMRGMRSNSPTVNRALNLIRLDGKANAAAVVSAPLSRRTFLDAMGAAAVAATAPASRAGKHAIKNLDAVSKPVHAAGQSVLDVATHPAVAGSAISKVTGNPWPKRIGIGLTVGGTAASAAAGAAALHANKKYQSVKKSSAAWYTTKGINAIMPSYARPVRQLELRSIYRRLARQAASHANEKSESVKQSSAAWLTAKGIDAIMSSYARPNHMPEKLSRDNFNRNSFFLGNNNMNAIQLLAKEAASRCWTGYEPVPGKKPYSDGSCQPAGGKKKKKKKSEKRAALWDKLLRSGQLSEKAIAKIYNTLEFKPRARPWGQRKATLGDGDGDMRAGNRSFFPRTIPEKRTGGFLGFGGTTEPARIEPGLTRTRGQRDEVIRGLRKGQTTGKPYAPMSDILKQLAASKAAQKASRGSSKLDKKMFKKELGPAALPEKQSSMSSMAIRELIERAGGKATPEMLDAFSQARRSIPYGAGTEIKDLKRALGPLRSQAPLDRAKIKELQSQIDKMKQTGRQARGSRKAMQGQNRGLENQVAGDAERIKGLEGKVNQGRNTTDYYRNKANQNRTIADGYKRESAHARNRMQEARDQAEMLATRPTTGEMQQAVRDARTVGNKSTIAAGVGGLAGGAAIAGGGRALSGGDRSQPNVGSPSSEIAKAPKPAIKQVAKAAAFEAYVKQAEEADGVMGSMASDGYSNAAKLSPHTALLGAAAGAGIGGLKGLIAPGEDEEGEKKNRILAALESAGTGGLVGGAAGGLAPLAALAYAKHVSPAHRRIMDMQRPKISG